MRSRGGDMSASADERGSIVAADVGGAALEATLPDHAPAEVDADQTVSANASASLIAAEVAGAAVEATTPSPHSYAETSDDSVISPDSRHRLRLRRLLMISDTSAVAAIGCLAVVSGRYLELALIGCWWLLMMIRFDRQRRFREFLDLEQIPRYWAGLIAVAAVLGAFVTESTARTRFSITALSTLALLAYAFRVLARSRRVQHILDLRLCESVLLVGERDDVARTLREWAHVDSIEVIGVCLPSVDHGVRVVEGHPVLGSARDIVDVCRRYPVDAVALHDCVDLGGRKLARLQWALEQSKTFVSLITPVANTSVQRIRPRAAGRRMIVDVTPATPSGPAAFVKSALDRVGAAAIFVITAPILLIAVIAIRATSHGPAFFSQVRVRENNRTFVMYKLRSMRVGADAEKAALLSLNEIKGGGLFKMRRDPRVTPVGRILRQLSIDELPQLVNVMKGEMSLVGPRPALPAEVATYDDMARRRLAVKPGLTGLWQVRGRSNLSYEEAVRLDMDYVDNWSPGLDAQIAINTVRAVIKRDGAY